MKKWNTERRKSALSRLQVQLESNQKVTKSGEVVTLTEKDKNRIEKEVTTLKSRV